MSPSGGVIDENGYLVRKTDNDAFHEYHGFLSELKEYRISHLSDILDFSATKFGSDRALGTRCILGKHRVDGEDGKIVEKLTLGPYKWMTYTEVRNQSISIGQGLRGISESSISKAAIFAETRADWFLSAMGCIYEGIIVVTLYNTLSDSALIHALNETEVEVMFTSYQMLSRLLKIKDSFLFLKSLIVMMEYSDDINKFSDMKGNMNLIKFNDLFRTDKYLTGSNYIWKDQENIAIIMYTSGSTGIPKGVELSHKNILASIYAYPSTMHITSNDRYLAFLPLAHIMELIAELSCVAIKVPILYSSPTTLTSKSPRVMPGCLGDAKIGQPTFTMSVPLVLDRIMKGVLRKVASDGYVKAWAFNIALKLKIWFSNYSLICDILDSLIFSRVQEELGGKLKIIGVGGSPLAAHTHETMRAMFGCSIRAGYGTTETAACVSGMDWRDNSTGHVGPPNFGVYVRLVQKKGEANGKENQGDIHAGGDVIAKRYFKRNRETFDNFYERDGIRWFITGDYGEITKNGCLKIIDRKRDYIKLKHGEYISLLKIETVYKSHMLVENICVIANPYKENVVAILVPSAENAAVYPNIFKQMCERRDDISSLYNCTKFNKQILNELSTYGKEMGLSKFEIPIAIHITADVWSPESGLLTGSLKLRRNEIERKYSSKISAMMSKIN